MVFKARPLIGLLKSGRPECLLHLSPKATICHKSELPQKEVRHWPYETRSYGLWNFWLDPFCERKITDNSKIIQVEGNIACGKDEFCKQLAEELGMKYFPPIDLEAYYINDHGYDYRALNPLLPERLRLCDWEMFHENPSRHSVIHLLQYVIKLKAVQYIKALQHVFNTGQGVILNRSVFTDRVFVDAMHNIGWLPMGYLRSDGIRFYNWQHRYHFARNLLLGQLFKPHLTIYLDTPVETCMDRIKNDPNPMISNSQALVPEFLENIEDRYKNDLLTKCFYYGHVIEFDHPKSKTKAEIMDVIDEIKKLDFEYDYHDTHFLDWNTTRTFCFYFFNRCHFTNLNCLEALTALDQPWYDIAGMGDSIDQADLILRETLFESHVGKMGWLTGKSTDPRLSNPIAAFFDYKDFGKRMDNLIRCDFR